MSLEIDIRKKMYDNHTVLEDIQFTLEDGFCYGFIGKNGSGKTTLFNCIIGLTNFSGNICHSKHLPFKNIVGYLPSEPYFVPRITAEEYIHFCLHARNKTIPNLQKENIFDLPLKQYATTFSTGMKKKLALWALLLQDNEYYILDEPFSGLDFEGQRQVTQIFEMLIEKSKTLCFSSHILSHMTATCQLIYHLEDGSIKKVYKPDEYNLI